MPKKKKQQEKSSDKPDPSSQTTKQDSSSSSSSSQTEKKLSSSNLTPNRFQIFSSPQPISIASPKIWADIAEEEDEKQLYFERLKQWVES